MRGRLKKLLLILGGATVVGGFMQFTFESKIAHESVLPVVKQMPPFIDEQPKWCDSTYRNLSLDEKIGQMIMVAAYPKKGEADKQRVAGLIQKNKVGGVIFFQGTPEQVAELSAYYQSISDIPLMIAIDGEWGLSMRLSNTIKYPKQMMLGAITDEMLIYEMGKDIGEQLRNIGVHVNFAPVVDVNNNADNPVINSRSFGENRINVARKGILYMKGMQDEGVLAFAKHFPGHGDTETDSHHGLPVVHHSKQRLDSLELYPFRALINAGVGGVMIAHMNVLALDSTPNLASTLSPKIVDSLLLKRMAFKGLVVTDAMNMKGVSGYHTPVKANKMAVKAGNDILLMPAEEEASIFAIKQAVESGEIDIDRINTSCQKILKAKQWIKQSDINQNYKHDSLLKDEYYVNHKKLIEASLTVVKNDNDLLPLQRIDTLRIGHVKIGPSNGNDFSKILKRYSKVDVFTPDADLDSAEYAELRKMLLPYNLVIVSIHSNSIWASRNFNLKEKELELVSRLTSELNTVLVGFVNPYVLAKLGNLDSNAAIVQSYENDPVTQSSTAQLIFGAVRASGVLPVSLSDEFPVNTGIITDKLNRFKYVSPREAGFDEKKLQHPIDSIVADAIQQKAMPGCQVFAAKNGKVFFYKSYGYHTYSKNLPVTEQDLYDLASLTKISATVPSVIKLQGEKKIDVNDKLGKYFPEFDTCDKKDLVLKDILLHQAGLKSWIPFYYSTIEPVHPEQNILSSKYSETYPVKIGPGAYVNKHLRYKEGYFNKTQTDSFSYQVADNLYLKNNISDSIWIKIAAAPLEEKRYRYSDLGFYLFYRMVERETKMEFSQYVDSVFYKPLGASSLCYKPLNFYDKDRIIPTENDLVFRKQMVHGHVHDPGAAMLGGVSGHAGLFGNANDLAKLMQMYLNGGKYGGETYLDKKTVRTFTSKASFKTSNRRGLGFDKPYEDTTKNGPGFKGISAESFGHTGFTGTMAWADPSTGILYVFLSNRVYPDAANTKLISMDVRTKIQEAIYNAQKPEEVILSE